MTFYEKLSFNFIRDIGPVAGVMRVPYVMVVNPSVPAKTAPEFIAYAKANPGKINMASSGNGGGDHMSGELFKMLTSVSMVHVPYRGNAPALTDLIGGQVQVNFAPLLSVIEYIRTGKLRALRLCAANPGNRRRDIEGESASSGKDIRSGVDLSTSRLGDLALDLVGNGGAVRLRRRPPTARSGPHWVNGAY
jgi:hypothetical protein